MPLGSHAGRRLSRLRDPRGRIVAPTIIAYADEHEIDLIVMGTRRRWGVKHLLQGSVTEGGVHTTYCPLLVVHADEAQAPETAVRRILVPLDCSPCSRSALSVAGILASSYGAGLILLRVIERFPLSEFYWPEYDTVVEETSPKVEARFREEMARLAAQAIASDVPVEQYIRDGDPSSVVIDFATEHDVDLIVMTSHRRVGLKHFLLGSVTKKVMRAAPCPVLVVKA